MNTALRKVVTPATRLTRSISDRIAHAKIPTMDQMVKPSGSWEEGMAKRQAFYNKFMAGGVLFCVSSFAYVYNAGFFKGLAPPKIEK